MINKEIARLLRPKGDYDKTDLHHYTMLTGALVRTALLSKKPDVLIPLFALIEDKDPSVGSELEKRTASIENRFYTHDAGKEMHESIEEVISAAMDAKLYGVGVLELYLDESGRYAYRRVDKEYLFFEDGKIYLKSGDKKIEPKAPKFLVLRHKPVMLKLLWIVFAKHFVLSHFLKFAEFLGVPPLVAHIDIGDEDAISTVMEEMRAIKSESFAVLGREDVLKVLEGRGSQEDFLSFVRYADAEIAKVVNGQVLTSNVGSSGSLAQAQVHESSREEIIAKDAKYAAACVKHAFAPIGIAPNLVIFIEKDKDLLLRAQTLKLLFEMGFTIGIDDASKEFDLPLLARAQTNADGSQGGGFTRAVWSANSAKPSDRFDLFFQSPAFAAVLGAGEANVKREIETMVAGAGSFEEAFDLLASRYPEVKLEELEEAFVAILANADILGEGEGDE